MTPLLPIPRDVERGTGSGAHSGREPVDGDRALRRDAGIRLEPAPKRGSDLSAFLRLRERLLALLRSVASITMPSRRVSG